MPDLTLPYSIQPDDDATAEVIMAQFNAIVTLLNSTGLDGDNVDASPSTPIPYSALDLEGGIDADDLAANIVGPAKLATPTRGSAANGALVSQGSPNTYATVVTVTIATAGFYDFVGEARCQNGGSGASGQIQTILSLQKNGVAQGIGDVWKTAETVHFTRTHHVKESFACVVGDVITLKIQSNIGAFVSIDVPAGYGTIKWERRSQ